LHTGITTTNLQKNLLGCCIHLLVQTFFLCIGITYISLFLSDILTSNLLSSNYALVFKLGQNLSNIPRSIISKHTFSLIIPFSEHKSSISYLFSSDQTSLLNTELHKSILCFLLFSSQQSQFQVLAFVGTGADPGFNASTMHQKNPNYWPFRQHLRSR
jgi:hypothetical protein